MSNNTTIQARKDNETETVTPGVYQPNSAAKVHEETRLFLFNRLSDDIDKAIDANGGRLPRGFFKSLLAEVIKNQATAWVTEGMLRSFHHRRRKANMTLSTANVSMESDMDGASTWPSYSNSSN